MRGLRHAWFRFVCFGTCFVISCSEDLVQNRFYFEANGFYPPSHSPQIHPLLGTWSDYRAFDTSDCNHFQLPVQEPDSEVIRPAHCLF